MNGESFPIPNPSRTISTARDAARMSRSISHQALSGQLAARGLRALAREEYVEKFRFPVRHFYEELGFRTEPADLEALSSDFIARYDAGVWSCSLHAGVAETLTALQAAGVRQAILSAAQEHYLHRQVSHSGIDSIFERICGQDDHSAEGKLARGRRFLAESGWAPDETLLVGDTDHDFEVGAALGLEVILVTGGHQSTARLRSVTHRVVERCSP